MAKGRGGGLGLQASVVMLTALATLLFAGCGAQGQATAPPRAAATGQPGSTTTAPVEPPVGTTPSHDIDRAEARSALVTVQDAKTWLGWRTKGAQERQPNDWGVVDPADMGPSSDPGSNATTTTSPGRDGCRSTSSAADSKVVWKEARMLSGGPFLVPNVNHQIVKMDRAKDIMAGWGDPSACAPGATKLDLPALGDEAIGYRLPNPEPTAEPPIVTELILVRRGPYVSSMAMVTYAGDDRIEGFVDLATALDQRFAAIVGGPAGTSPSATTTTLPQERVAQDRYLAEIQRLELPSHGFSGPKVTRGGRPTCGEFDEGCKVAFVDASFTYEGDRASAVDALTEALRSHGRRASPENLRECDGSGSCHRVAPRRISVYCAPWSYSIELADGRPGTVKVSITINGSFAQNTNC